VPLLLSSWIVAAALAFEPSLFEAGSHCVAYRVKTTKFLVKTDTVTGKNCDVSAQVLPEVGGLYHIEVNIPIRGFDSEDSERDRDVMKVLKAEMRPELTFKSVSRSPEQWRELFEKGEFPLEGELFIGEKSYPVKFNSKFTQKEDAGEIDGRGTVKFADFDIKPPKVGGGVVASVKPDLELHFHFVSQRILGADSIRPDKVEDKKPEAPKGGS